MDLMNDDLGDTQSKLIHRKIQHIYNNSLILKLCKKAGITEDELLDHIDIVTNVIQKGIKKPNTVMGNVAMTACDQMRNQTIKEIKQLWSYYE